MSRWITQALKYKCDGECDMPIGYCEKENIMILRTNKDLDIVQLYHKEHVDESNSKLKYVGQFTESDIRTIALLFNHNTGYDFLHTKQGDQIYKEMEKLINNENNQQSI
jgi:hypothetical protein